MKTWLLNNHFVSNIVLNLQLSKVESFVMLVMILFVDLYCYKCYKGGYKDITKGKPRFKGICRYYKGSKWKSMKDEVKKVYNDKEVKLKEVYLIVLKKYNAGGGEEGFHFFHVKRKPLHKTTFGKP